MNERENEEWLRLLREPGAQASAAIADLRHVVRGGLQRALAGRASVGDAQIDDLTQDATLKVLGALDSFRGASRFTTWAITISIRVALTELRRARWKDVSLDQLTESTGEPSAVATPDANAHVARERMIAALYQVLDTELTERQRRALIAELKGMPQAEVAAQLGMNRNALYKLTHDARRKLRQGLAAGGFSEDDVREAFELPSQGGMPPRGAP
ncbi:sigma-70 family RNA polymerase sigma factor [Sorangium sp. So ce367]|uniref:sigma-70 family RNA polymerase sigma factor n=1 Tax=Sorangium sp. So ce367 TaxID=3133305 RepID=UPI003F5F8814